VEYPDTLKRPRGHPWPGQAHREGLTERGSLPDAALLAARLPGRTVGAARRSQISADCLQGRYLRTPLI